MSEIIVHFDQPVGKIKPMNAVNNGPLIKRADQSRGNSDNYAAARIPFARNHDASFNSSYGGNHSVDIGFIFPNFDADPEDPASYDFVLTDQYIAETQSVGTETFYRLGSRIEHEIKKYGTVKPKDFRKWAVICEHIIRHMNEGWANGHHFGIRYWEIWNEADLDADDSANKRCWGGTKAEFFDLFETAAKHLKACFPDLYIGGPASCGNMEWSKDFIHEMAARRVPMDFFSWHIYTDAPRDMVDRGNTIRAWLDESGYNHTASICDEWNYIYHKDGWSTNFVYGIKQIIGMKGAAMIADILNRGQDSSIDMLMYYDARPCAFNGLFDFYTMEPLKGYYPIFHWGQLTELGTQVACEIDHEVPFSADEADYRRGGELRAVAARSETGKCGILVSLYESDDEVQYKVPVRIKLSGINAGAAEIRYTDGSVTMETTKVNADIPLILVMASNSFAYIEL